MTADPPPSPSTVDGDGDGGDGTNAGGPDLRTGTSLWVRRDGPGPTRPPPAADLRCDVAVVGGGVSGAMCALHLAEAGADVVLLERGRIGAGSTAASTALVIYELDMPLVEMAELRGRRFAERAWRLCRDAVGRVEDVVRRLDADVGWARRESVQLASSDDDARMLEREHAARRAAGLDVDLLSADDVTDRFPFRRPAALLTPVAAEIDPFRFTRALAGAAERAGARVFERSEVDGYDPVRDGVVLRTARGVRVRARRVVWATGYETQRWLPERVVDLKSSYAVATKPVEEWTGWQGRETIWETAHPYLYLRTTEDGRALVGGEDEEFTDPDLRDARVPDKARTLMEKLRRLFPDVQVEAGSAWAGTFGETEDSLPYVGTVPSFENAIFSLTYGANGMVFALLGAEMVRDAVLGRENGDAELFRFGR